MALKYRDYLRYNIIADRSGLHDGAIDGFMFNSGGNATVSFWVTALGTNLHFNHGQRVAGTSLMFFEDRVTLYSSSRAEITASPLKEAGTTP